MLHCLAQLETSICAMASPARQDRRRHLTNNFILREHFRLWQTQQLRLGGISSEDNKARRVPTVAKERFKRS